MRSLLARIRDRSLDAHEQADEPLQGRGARRERLRKREFAEQRGRVRAAPAGGSLRTSGRAKTPTSSAATRSSAPAKISRASIGA